VVNTWFDKERRREEMANHCDHSPIGFCGEPACDAKVQAGHIN
jgi:hypothetical protein